MPRHSFPDTAIFPSSSTSAATVPSSQKFKLVAAILSSPSYASSKMCDKIGNVVRAPTVAAERKRRAVSKALPITRHCMTACLLLASLIILKTVSELRITVKTLLVNPSANSLSRLPIGGHQAMPFGGKAKETPLTLTPHSLNPRRCRLKFTAFRGGQGRLS